MHLLRHLRPECIELSLGYAPREPAADESEAQGRKRLAADKEAVLVELASLVARSGLVVNQAKLRRDLINREHKATTAIAPGIAIPHVRTLQVRDFVISLARAPGAGVPFGSLDGGPTRLFLVLVSPPYADRLYLQVYREFAELVQDEERVERLLTAATVQDVLQVMRAFFIR